MNLNVTGKRIASERKAQGWTQQELADKLIIKREMVVYYEKGQRSLKVEQLAMLAKLFGVSTDYLLGFTGVRSADADILAACKTTGLNEEAIKILHYMTNLSETDIETEDMELMESIKELRLSIKSSHPISIGYINVLNALLTSREFHLASSELSMAKWYKTLNDNPPDSQVYLKKDEKEIAMKVIRELPKAGYYIYPPSESSIMAYLNALESIRYAFRDIWDKEANHATQSNHP